MDAAEQTSRKNRKPSKSVDALAQAARLRVLELKLGVPINRHRDPGNVSNMNPYAQKGSAEERSKDVSVIIKSGF